MTISARRKPKILELVLGRDAVESAVLSHDLSSVVSLSNYVYALES